MTNRTANLIALASGAGPVGGGGVLDIIPDLPADRKTVAVCLFGGIVAGAGDPILMNSILHRAAPRSWVWSLPPVI